MSVVLAFDTATPATVAGLSIAGRRLLARRDDPAPGARPGHAQRLLALCQDMLDEAELGWPDVERLGVGVGPGTFTGLRIGVATARALSQATGAELVAISTLEALAAGARAAWPEAGQPAASEALSPAVAAVIDARRGEVFAATWDSAGRALSAPAAVPPESLPALADPAFGPWLAVGDGAVGFRDRLEPALVTVPCDGSRLHRLDAAALCGLAASGSAVDREALLPQYVRRPDAEISRRPT